MRVTVLLLGLLVLGLPGARPAAAQHYDAAPQVEGRVSGGAANVRASMDVAASPEAVFAVLSDCDGAPRFMRRLISCRVLESGEGWDVREHRVRGWLLQPVLRNVARVELEPYRRLAFHRLAGDWTRSDGEWVLRPIDGGRGTHVDYRVAADFAGPLPHSATQALLVRDVRAMLLSLRDIAEARAAR